MSYYSQWQDILNGGGQEPEAEEQIRQYYELETAAYDKILESGQSKLTGTASDLAQDLGFGDQMAIFIGFLDGINSSLETTIDLDKVEDDTPIELEVDFKRLYWQMHEVKADWLYNLESWDHVFPAETRQQMTRAFKTSKIIRREKIGRNDLCPCGSGKKYKNCCGKGA